MFLSGGRIGCGIDNGLPLAQACLRMGRDTRNQHEPAQKDSQKKAVIHTAPVFCKCSHSDGASCGAVHHREQKIFAFLPDL
jgi:hypothetical protein